MTQPIQAVVFTARERAELLTLDKPLGEPLPDEVAGRTLVTLVSAGTELLGRYVTDKTPAWPGYAAVFEVEAVGANVADVKVGDRLFCMGKHQSHQRVAANMTVAVPAGLADEDAPFVRMMGVSMATLSSTAARPGQRVMVTGLGLVGHLAAQIFQTCGYRVVGVDPDENRREIALGVGIETVLPAVPVDDGAFVGSIDLHLECSGHEQAALDGCSVVRKRGEVVQIGAPWSRRTDIYAQTLLDKVFFRYVTLRSGWEWELPMHAEDFRPHSIFGNYATAMSWLHSGRVKVGDLYELASPRQAQDVYQDLLHRRVESLAKSFDWRAL
ncbi:MAG: zinc-binding alcohol dehydrogenase [Caldilineaceae bacterium]|nr:zinc-binding alcohol dehydrogenase [Caldilineaceae bacterium]